MAKFLSCREAGADCDFTACASTEDELFRKAADHARKDHNMSEISKEMQDKCRSVMRDVERC